MSKGRNTSVISVRVPDHVADRLKSMAKKRRLTMTELLKPVIGNFAVRGYVPQVILPFIESEGKEKMDAGNPFYEPDEPGPITERLKDKFPAQVEKYAGTSRNAPCPCGAKHTDGRPKKYKHCCGK